MLEKGKFILDSGPDLDQSQTGWSLTEVLSFHKIWFKPVNKFFEIFGDKHTDRQIDRQTDRGYYITSTTSLAGVNIDCSDKVILSNFTAHYKLFYSTIQLYCCKHVNKSSSSSSNTDLSASRTVLHCRTECRGCENSSLPFDVSISRRDFPLNSSVMSTSCNVDRVKRRA